MASDKVYGGRVSFGGGVFVSCAIPPSLKLRMTKRAVPPSLKLRRTKRAVPPSLKLRMTKRAIPDSLRSSGLRRVAPRVQSCKRLIIFIKLLINIKYLEKEKPYNSTDLPGGMQRA